MASIDIISNGLNVIINAQRSGKKTAVFPTNKVMNGIVEVMQRKRYVEKFESIGEDKKNFLSVTLKYDFSGKGIIREVKRHSKCARRLYSKAKDIPRVNNGYATMIVSTPKGIMTGREAREMNVGGEVICHIF